MDHARGGNGFGIVPVSFLEMAAWSQLVDEKLEPWEVRAIRSIDRAYVEQMSQD
jgi:hypothetical protein